MAMTKLTLSAEADLIVDAKRWASSRRTSVSGMFARFLRSIEQIERDPSAPIAPLTRQATGLLNFQRNRSDQELVEDALSDKHRLTR
jgi:hypothetical protein